MAKVKKGDVFSCSACGLIISVDEACGCVTSDLICCDEPMLKGKAAAAKAKSAKTAKPAPAAKSVKGKPAAPKKPVAKKAAAPKPKAKSTAAKKR